MLNINCGFYEYSCRRNLTLNIGLRGPFKGRVPVSQVHVHCSGLFLPMDAAENFWSFLAGTAIEKRHFSFNVWYVAL